MAYLLGIDFRCLITLHQDSRHVDALEEKCTAKQDKGIASEIILIFNHVYDTRHALQNLAARWIYNRFTILPNAYLR